MKIIQHDDELSEKYESAKKYVNEKVIFIDIETTGFSKEFCRIYLISLCTLRDGIIHAVQFLSDSEDDEKDILTSAFNFISDFENMITYNGRAFDLPFLKRRSEVQNISCPIDNKKDTDLYRIAKNLHFLYDGVGLKLKSIEKFLGIKRTDEKNGGELIKEYQKYIALIENDRANNSAEIDRLENELLLHNYEDVINLVPLMVLFEYQKLLKPKVTIEKFEVTEREIFFSGKTNANITNPFFLKNDYCFLNFDRKNIKGTVKFVNGKLRYYLPDYKNYFYLPDENTILPKQFASAIPKNRRRAATMEECFVEKSPEEIDEKLLKAYADNVIKNLIRYGT
jgi:uncharacterized protein YprB with RNaseH-like and TPR domain